MHGHAFALQGCDDGPGIATADRERVFRHFVRLPGQVESGSGPGFSVRMGKMGAYAWAAAELTNAIL